MKTTEAITSKSYFLLVAHHSSLALVRTSRLFSRMLKFHVCVLEGSEVAKIRPRGIGILKDCRWKVGFQVFGLSTIGAFAPGRIQKR